ncbi:MULTISPECIES: MerR family transcriptional regulator [unclassified Pseudoalteromonas]|uniref:MerR family transcriptional regulator n=1 Tax=unclassified Pseudoalteromonas TaxID=194690 RepID=UPI0011085B23|nr:MULTISPECIES: MerR family transcriptional regulator [unclassified Pseudoalteromonas]TMN84659.1 MerR family transcriptional regulator [Pseudoalteromonas sp. S410]TMN91124.1 MerR family transcriptional regulator [Pseudoalteromonas sp. S408]TMN98003.1 MerR family transcriptional regulator [Pseudoalteromonas sp. S407]TMO01199.1 MerR family transcriptional regulator [Pseudoalteromonas sp. S409]TMO09194.1 MerR family transcriptional regulator [Pseudoalteromonas sp. S186]
MKISELAKLVGVAPSTIRYYESKGLLPKSSRNSNGYRQYEYSSIEQIKMIKFAQSLGFSLEEIPTLKTPENNLDHTVVIERLQQKQNEANALITQLQKKSQRIGSLITQLNSSWSNGQCLTQKQMSDLLNEGQF